MADAESELKELELDALWAELEIELSSIRCRWISSAAESFVVFGIDGRFAGLTVAQAKVFVVDKYSKVSE